MFFKVMVVTTVRMSGPSESVSIRDTNAMANGCRCPIEAGVAYGSHSPKIITFSLIRGFGVYVWFSSRDVGVASSRTE